MALPTLIAVIVVTLVHCPSTGRSQAQLVSPCPRLFSYEPQKENDRWYGVLTLISDTDLKGVWLRLVFDKPSLQLGNWFGEIKTTDNTEYLIKNPMHQLKANMPYALRFYITYNPNETPPQLQQFRLNARTICPEGVATTPAAITGGSQLITSAPVGGAAAVDSVAPVATRPPVINNRPVTPSGGQTFTRPGGGWPGGAAIATTEDDDVFQGDFQLINRPHLRPTAEPECGTVVKLGGAAKRTIRELKSNINTRQSGRPPPPPQQQQWSTVSLQEFIRNITKHPEKRMMTMSHQKAPPEWSASSNQDQIAPLEQQPKPLITYGQSTSEGEFPWHVALYHERGADLQYICGASLISRHHVITVAHCVTRRRSATALNPDSLVVYLGKYYLKKWSNAGIQDSQVEMIIPHPQYNSVTYANDVAILKLQHTVTITDYVRPVCLWSESAEISSVIGQPGTVVGWGFDHTGKVTEELTQAKMPVVSKETCIYSFPDFFSRFTTNKTYCAGFRNGTSVCNGDSGGGMVFPKKSTTTTSGPGGRQVWQLRGLVSISVALQNQFKCDSSHYVVFTDVAKYLDWIAQAMLQ